MDFTPDQEARLSELAATGGMDTAHLVRGAASRLLGEDLPAAGVEDKARALENWARSHPVMPPLPGWMKP